MKDTYTVSLVFGKRKLFNCYEDGKFIGQIRYGNHKNGFSSFAYSSDYINNLPYENRAYLSYLVQKKLNIL